MLVRVRPFNDRELKFNQSSALEVDDNNNQSSASIDFGLTSSVSATTNDNSKNDTNGSSSSKGTITIVDQGSASGGYGSGYDSGANNNNSNAAPPRQFTYDAVFGPTSQQHQIYDSVKGIIDAVCAGYNGTIVAYGQTGSGKTHTIFGGDDGLLLGEEEQQDNDTDTAGLGLVQRSLKSIFAKIAEQNSYSSSTATDTDSLATNSPGGLSIRTTTKASFFEIYNEQVYDLLSSQQDNLSSSEESKGLLVREDVTKGGVYVEGLVECDVSNTNEALHILRTGMDNRHTASTQMNRVSSRSHAMFVLTVRSELFSENGTVSKVRVSKFTLVDLAGSERQKATATEGVNLKEASMINNSLLCLGQVINSLVDRETKGKMNHVPFRDSKLTFLLRDSWGGNSKTCLVATVTPSFASLSETLSTLKFAQRAKLIKNTAVLNENTCGSVAALQKEITRLRAELELKTTSSADAPMSSSSNDDDQKMAAATNDDEKMKQTTDNNITVSALHNQNTKLNKKAKVLKDASNHREMQVKSLKRKLQQETLIRKCKERRITYLSNKGKTSSGIDTDDVNGNGNNNNDEVSTLQEEVNILREQLDTQPSESVEWMIKYKEEKAKVDEMQTHASTTLEANEKSRLEGSIVTLLGEKQTLQQTVESMSSERNSEIDAIINDVTKLENANIMLQSQLDKKDLVIMANNDKIQSSEAQLDELEEEVKSTLDCLESTQNEFAAEKERTNELQQSVDSIKIEVEEANAAAAEHQNKVTIVEEELKKLSEQHDESTTALNTKLSEIQKDLDAAMDGNESLMTKLKDASDDLEARKSELECLEEEKSEALKQLEVSQEKNDANIELFKLQEAELRAEIKKGEEAIESLLVEKTDTTSNLERITAENTLLSNEVEALKTERNELLERVKSLDKLHVQVESLEDEVTFMEIEKEQVDEQLRLVHNDLERTIRLQEHLHNTQTALQEDELARCDEIINRLSNEKVQVQDELAKVSQTLAESTASSEEKIAELQNNLSELQAHADSLNAELKKAEEVFEKEKTDATQELDKVTAQSNALSEEMDVLRTDRDESMSVLNTKITELQKDLDTATDEKKSLTKKLEEASADLGDKQAQLESLELEKDGLLKQLEEGEEKSAVDIETFKQQEESMRAEIINAEEKIESLAAEKTVATASIEKVTKQCTLLSEEVETLTSERDELQQRVQNLDKLRVDLASLEDEVEHVKIEKGELEVKIKFTEADLERTVRLHEESVAAQRATHDNDLAQRDDIIDTLTIDKSNLQEELASVNQKLIDSSTDSDEKLGMLQNESK